MDIDISTKLDFNEKQLTDLPTEVLCHVLSYVSVSDRIAFGATCRQFYEASCVLEFCDEQKFLVYKKQLEERKSPITVLERSIRPFLHFKFVSVDFNDPIRKFWNQYGPAMRSLNFIKCDIREKTLVDVLYSCSSLQELRIVDCREPLMFGKLLKSVEQVTELRTRLQHLQAIDLSNNRYLSDALFSRLTGLTNNIRYLSLSGCHITFHHGLYLKYYPENYNGAASESVLTYQYIIEFIAAQALSLKNLDFSSTLIDKSALALLSKIEGLKLEVLTIKSCDQMTNPGLMALVEHQTHLVELNLNFCKRITDPGLIALCNSRLNLRRLFIASCGAITDASISELYKLLKLETLDISYYGTVSSEGIHKGISSRSSTFLKELHMCKMDVTEDQVIAIAKNYPNLTVLDLSACRPGVTDKSVQAICRHLCWLRILRLDHCLITDLGLTGIATDCRYKDEFEVEDIVINPELSDDDEAQGMPMRLSRENESVYNVGQLRGLQELSLVASEITDFSLKYCFRFNELQILNLNHTRVSFKGIKYMVRGCRSLEELSLKYCDNIGNPSVRIIVDYLPRLRVLSLNHCEDVTNEGAFYIVSHGKAIKIASMIGCPSVDYDFGQCAISDGPSRTIKFDPLATLFAENAPLPPLPPLYMRMLFSCR